MKNDGDTSKHKQVNAVVFFVKSEGVRGNESKYPRWLHLVGFNISQNLISPYATYTFPIMHLICRPKFCISIVFNFSWDSCDTSFEMKNNGYAKFGGANKVHYGKCGSGV